MTEDISHFISWLSFIQLNIFNVGASYTNASEQLLIEHKYPLGQIDRLNLLLKVHLSIDLR